MQLVDKGVVFIVLNYNTWEESIKCVDSIIGTYPFQKRILVVDNASPNNSFEYLNSYFKGSKYDGVEVIKTEYNGGFSYGNNFAYKYLKERYRFEYLVFTNNDIIFLPNAIAYMIEVLMKKEDSLQVAPMVKNLDNQPITLPLKKNRGIWQAFGISRNCDTVYKVEELDKLKQVYLVSGCCFVVNAKYFEEIGCFDENIFLYNEENILSKKANDKNLSIWLEPHSEVIHNQGASTGKKSIFVDKEFLKSSMYYYRKYEKKNFFIIVILWFYYILRITSKIFMGRYQDSRGYLKCIKETYLSLIRLF